MKKTYPAKCICLAELKNNNNKQCFMFVQCNLGQAAIKQTDKMTTGLSTINSA